MALTLTEILERLTSDTHPGPDGCNNLDRLAFIMEVLGCEMINLNEHYNFAPVLHSKTPDLIEASKHIAMLQLDYLKRAHENDHIDELSYQHQKASLILDINKLDWHYEHLIEGRPTPPFRFIH